MEEKIMNKNFYPTPKSIIDRMINKITTDPIMILEPSAGEGHIIEHFKNRYRNYRAKKYDAIEIDETLRATLRGKKINIIDSDFLQFAGPDKYDLIIGNPPFDKGDQHLLKAIDIMYNGEIVFLLNAETIKNPYSNLRKMLVKKLEELNADIEYIQDAFLDAERKTEVEVALIYIKIENQVENDIFINVDDVAKDKEAKIESENEIQGLNNIKNMVDDFNRVSIIGIETLINYYQNYNHIGKYIQITDGNENSLDYENSNLTLKLQSAINIFLRDLRASYWKETLNLDAVKKRMTTKKEKSFYQLLGDQSYMDFTESNIRNFIINIIGSYEKTLTDAVVDIFDQFTHRHAWDEKLHNDNVHYFNGWKTNKAFYANKKIIIPYIYCWDEMFKKWKVGYQHRDNMRDIDTVMNYFDGLDAYESIEKSLEKAFADGITRKILSTYFEISCFKKGTIHLIFRNEDIRRRFNIIACKGKNWLPQDYGDIPFNELKEDEKDIVKSFETEKKYTKNIKRPLFEKKNNRLMIPE